MKNASIRVQNGAGIHHNASAIVQNRAGILKNQAVILKNACAILKNESVILLFGALILKNEGRILHHHIRILIGLTARLAARENTAIAPGSARPLSNARVERFSVHPHADHAGGIGDPLLSGLEAFPPASFKLDSCRTRLPPAQTV